MWLPPEGKRKRLYLVSGIGGATIVLLLGAWRFLSPREDLACSAAPSNAEIQQVQQTAKRGDVEGLKQAARSSNTVAASTAVYELSRRSDARQHVPMYREMMAPSYAAPVRVQAVSAFGRNAPTRESYQEVEKVARDEADVAVKLAAISTLEQMQPAWRSLGTLVTLMDHADERVRAAALHAFQTIARLRIDTTDPETKQPGYKPADPPAQRRAVLARVQRQFLGNTVLAARYDEWAQTEWPHASSRISRGVPSERPAARSAVGGRVCPVPVASAPPTSNRTPTEDGPGPVRAALRSVRNAPISRPVVRRPPAARSAARSPSRSSSSRSA